jgi:predicted nucleic acid-binding protein
MPKIKLIIDTNLWVSYLGLAEKLLNYFGREYFGALHLLKTLLII